MITTASTDEDVDEFHSVCFDMFDPTKFSSTLAIVDDASIDIDKTLSNIDDNNQSYDLHMPMKNELLLSSSAAIASTHATVPIDDTKRSPFYDPYGGYELESVTDEDDDDYDEQQVHSECLITSEAIEPIQTIPARFEFKLPTFGEWIDRAFMTFLTETNPKMSTSISSSRSSSIVSLVDTQPSTIPTCSSSSINTVIEQIKDIQTTPLDLGSDDDESSCNGMTWLFFTLKFFYFIY
jgi:hypothetical protein